MPKIATSGNDSFRKHMPCKQNIRILARDVLSGHSRATAPTGDYERVGLVPDGMEGDESVRIINSSISENKNNNNNHNNHNNNTSNTTTQTNANNNNNHSNSHHANSNNSSCVFGDNNANAAPRASMTMEAEQDENVNNVAPADAVNAVNVVPGAEGGPMGPMVPGAGVLPQYFGMNGMGPGGLAQVEGVQDVSMPGAAAIDAPPPHLAIAGPSATRARGARGRAGGVPPRANSKKGNELLGRTGMKKEVNRSIFSHMKVKERSVKTIEMNEQRRRRDYVLKPLKRLKGAIPMPAPMARKDDDAYDAQEQKEDDDWDMGAGNNNNNNNNNGSNGKYEINDYGTNKSNNNHNNNANPFETMQTVAPIAQTGDEREDEDSIMNKNSGSSGCFGQFDTNLMEQENNCNSSNGSDAMASSGSNGSNGSNGKKGTKGIDCNDTFGPMSRGKSGPGSSSGTGATSAAHGTHGTNGTDGTKEKEILKGAKKLFEQNKLAEARNALKVLEESNNLGTALRNKIASLKRAIDAKEATIKAKEELAAWDDDI